MYSYYEVVRELELIYNLLSNVFDYLKSTLTPLLYLLTFAVLLYFGFKCVRGYRA